MVQPGKAMKLLVSIVLLLLIAPVTGWAHTPSQKTLSHSQKEISRERAIEIARPHVKFQPKSVKAEKIRERDRRVWRVTFRGEPPGQGSVMGEVMIISIDRVTGDIVSLAQS